MEMPLKYMYFDAYKLPPDMYLFFYFPGWETTNDINGATTSAVVDTTFVDIYVDTKNIPTCRYNIQHIDKRTKEK